MVVARHFLIALIAILACISLSSATPLDDYVNKPDNHFKWEQLSETFHGPGYKGYILNMTSQQWLTPQDTSRSIWWHYMAVVVPDKIDHTDTAALYITGGNNNNDIPNGKGEDELLCISIALTDNIVCTALFQVPNEHMVFSADPLKKSRTEDAIIAFTWYHYSVLDPSNPEWLLRLPMTKAAVRAMDATSEFLKTIKGQAIDKFVVAGASKRGWTTWTTGAVDKRVIAIIPIVMDLLNYHPNIHHMWRAYGGWTFAFKDYYELNFTANIDTPGSKAMFDIIDPYVYKDRLTMPKLVIDSCGDEFFMLDDNHYWWDDMPGEKHLIMVQDAEHSLVTGLVEVAEGITSFIRGVLSGHARPDMKWTMGYTDNGGYINITLSEAPTKIIVRHADTLDNKRRDFRLLTGENPCPTIEVSGACLHPVLWHGSEPTQTGSLTYTATFDNPPDGKWRAFFFEVKFRGDSPIAFVFTSQVNIIPNVFPFADCEGQACKGTLI